MKKLVYLVVFAVVAYTTYEYEEFKRAQHRKELIEKLAYEMYGGDTMYRIMHEGERTE